MKLNNKGFALTSMIYMLLVLFLMVMLLLLANLAQRKVVLDKIKHDVINKLDQGTSINAQELPYQNETTGIYYETLELALNKANSNDTIKVLKNVTDVSTPVVDENKDIKLDLAGNEITLSNRFTNNGTLDIYSSADGGTITSPVNAAISNIGTITFNGTSSDYTLYINNNSTTKTSTYSILDNFGSAALNNNVTMKYTDNSVSGTENRYLVTNAGMITVNGATLINNMDGLNGEYGIANTSTATNASIIINSGTIDTGGAALYNIGSTKNTIEDPAIKVAGGTIKSSANNAIYNSKGNSMIYITGGEVSSTGATTIQNNGNLNVTGGTIYAYEGSGILSTGAGNTIVSGGLITKEKNPVTNAWKGNSCFQIGDSANATITGNAVVQNELGNGSNVIYNAGSGTFTIDGNATVENKAAVNAGTNASYGKIIVNGGTIKSTGSTVLNNSYASSTSTKYGTIEINGGSLSTTASQTVSNTSAYGQIKVTGGTITATGTSTSYGAIYNTKANAKITITGGTITKANSPVYIASGSNNSTINITGGTITATAANAIYNKGAGATVTIGTQGAANNTYPNITGRIFGEGTCGLTTVNSGTITGTTSQAINSVSDITINGGVISASASYGIYSYNNANATLTINGGNITSSSTYALTSQNTTGATINITGGTITNISGANAVVNNHIGATTITGGTIKSNNGIGVYATTGSITIGTDGGTPSQTVPSITGAKYGVQKTSGSINFYDGKIVGQNGSGSSISGTVLTPTGYGIVKTLNSTTETAILGALRTITYDYNYMDSDIYGTKLVTANFSSSTSTGTTSKVDNNLAKYGKEARWTATSNNTAGGPHMSPGRLTVGNTYTWSVYVKASKNVLLNIGQEQNGRKGVNVTTEWQRVTHTFVAGDTQYNSFTFYISGDKWNAGDILYVHSLELKETPTLNITTDTKPSGAQLGTLPAPTRTDYTFDGWYTDPVGGTKISSTTTVPNDNTTYYARWIYNS